MDFTALGALAALSAGLSAFAPRPVAGKAAAIMAASAAFVSEAALAGPVPALLATSIAVLGVAAGTALRALRAWFDDRRPIDCYLLGGASSRWTAPSDHASEMLQGLFGGPILPHKAFSRILQLELSHQVATIEKEAGRLDIVIERNAEPADVITGIGPRERAIRMFANKGLWNTDNRDGVLVLVTLAGGTVEIVADRALASSAATSRFAALAKRMALSFRDDEFKEGLRHAAWEIARIIREAGAESETTPDVLPTMITTVPAISQETELAI